MLIYAAGGGEILCWQAKRHNESNSGTDSATRLGIHAGKGFSPFLTFRVICTKNSTRSLGKKVFVTKAGY